MRTNVLALAETLLVFVARHWAALFLGVLLLLVEFVFVPRQMFGAMIGAAIVGTGAVVGHWWA